MTITTSANKNTVGERDWFKVDAKDQVLGRLASKIAILLQGKHKAIYTRHFDTGDYVVVLNTSQITLTGNKAKKTMHHWHTGYPGGLKSASMGQLMEKDSTQVLKKAVQRMLPKGPLGRDMIKKLKIYKDDQHSHIAQKLQDWPFSTSK